MPERRRAEPIFGSRSGSCRPPLFALRFREVTSVAENSSNEKSVLYFYPEDVVEYHRQVRENGVTVPDLDVTFYGLTEFRLDDPDGNRLWIGQNVKRHV